MRLFLLVPVAMFLLLMFMILCSGCSDLPSMKYCDKIQYERNGAEILIQAHCMAPVGIGAGMVGF